MGSFIKYQYSGYSAIIIVALIMSIAYTVTFKKSYWINAITGSLAVLYATHAYREVNKIKTERDLKSFGPSASIIPMPP